MSEEFKYNHIIPQFILKNFATGLFCGDKKINKVWRYNIKSNKMFYNKINNCFGKNYLYWNEKEKDKVKLEKDLNTKLESGISQLFASKIYDKENTIELSRFELREIKRYILVQLIRIPDEHYDYWFGNKDKQDFWADFLKRIGRKKEFKDLSHLSQKEAMLHELTIIVNTPFEDIIEHVDCTPRLAKFIILFNSAYLGFWQADSKIDFIITDTYLVNERDSYVPYKTKMGSLPVFSKQRIVLSLLDKYKDRYNKGDIDNEFADLMGLNTTLINFHENVWFFPISNSLMIVLINPFYKNLLLNKLFKENMNLISELGIKTNIPLKYLSSNICYYTRQDEIYEKLQKNELINVMDYYDESDKYIYTIHHLDEITNKYVNVLMLDRVNICFGFKNKSKLLKNIQFYIDYPATGKLIDYNILLKKLKEE